MDTETKAFDIREALKGLPDLPGVYLHKDASGQVIYVGKARSLRNRVRQYFQSPSNMDPKVRKMVEHIAEFQYITTATEMEALLLESHLIKTYMPRYNVLLRDDKTFPYIKVTLNEEWPRLVKTRRITEDGSRYFGPYTDAALAAEIVDLLNSIFALKRCRTSKFPPGFTPCLNYHLAQCKGICGGDCDPEEYRRSLEGAMEFLSGRTEGVLTDLRRRMEEEAEALRFEQAAVYRDHIAAVEAVPDQKRLDRFLEAMGHNRVQVDQRALKKRGRAAEAAMAAVYGDLARFVGLELPENPRGEETVPSYFRIEAYDISHTGGVYAVGVMVVFEDGLPRKKDYRRFKLRTAEGGDDCAALQEVIYRRFKRSLEGDPGFSRLPALLLIDGGRTQTEAVEKVLAALNTDIPVVGMVKDASHRTRGLIRGKSIMELRENRALFRHIAVIQEEVHRFAIEYHRGLRAREMQRSRLDGIPGVGEKRRNALLSSFGSIEAIAAASAEDLARVPGMNLAVAEKVKKVLHDSLAESEM
ncbi:MAG: excinuclease ABC subunit UvrC [Bacillota bacterium]|nr:excinuclease ABC subunit UvrC [Bacillota bacterium]